MVNLACQDALGVIKKEKCTNSAEIDAAVESDGDVSVVSDSDDDSQHLTGSLYLKVPFLGKY